MAGKLKQWNIYKIDYSATLLDSDSTRVYAIFTDETMDFMQTNTEVNDCNKINIMWFNSVYSKLELLQDKLYKIHKGDT